MKGSKTYATGYNALGEKVVLRTIKSREKSYIYVNDNLFAEINNFTSAIECFNGCVVRVKEN